MEAPKKIKIFVIFAIFLLSFLVCQSADAALLYFSPDSKVMNAGDIVNVAVIVNTSGSPINNAEAVINFPKDLLEVVSLSKSNSVFSLWVEDPAFSNANGTIHFNGGLPTPGYTGASGKILSIVFRAKAAGTASVLFLSGAVRANDGMGTDVLMAKTPANFIISKALEEPQIPEETPKITGFLTAKVTSPTHSNPEKWYSNKNPEFLWEMSKEATGASVLLSRNGQSNPGIISDGLLSSKKYENMEDGIWYFHISLQNNLGWGPIIHRKAMIDTHPPEAFQITFDDNVNKSNSSPIISYETTDKTSGIDYYEISVDQNPAVRIAEAKYQLPSQSPGRHKVTVKAVDKAGNNVMAMAEVDITGIAAPKITEYPQQLSAGQTLVVKGTSLPEAKIKLYTQKEGGVLQQTQIDSGKDGKWAYFDNQISEGLYKIWAEATDAFGGRSAPSGKVLIRVASAKPGFAEGLDIMIIVAMVLLTAVLVYRVRKIIKKKKVSTSEKALYLAFKTFEAEIYQHISKLDGKPGLSKKERAIYESLKKTLEISQKFVEKEIKDIEKRLEE